MKLRTVSAVLATAAVSACSVVPYENEPMCDVAGYGRCASVAEAYESSLSDDAETRNLPVVEGSVTSAPKPGNAAPPVPVPTPREAYQAALYQELAGLVQAPKTPMVRSPKVVRLLVLPYSDGPSGELYLARHVYFFLGRPEWLLAPEAHEGADR